MSASEVSAGRRLLPLSIILPVFALCVLIFALAQNVWIDETTQLSGATLTPGPLIGWLTGALKLPFGVPGDRMPPLSYLIDMIGWRIWGSNELAFRLYHAVIAGAGLALLVWAIAGRFGLRAAFITGLILALSPKLVETAVEIRAYPIFFALSCAQLALLLRGQVAARPGRLALFLLLGLLSGYTHFFGVVATSAYLVAAFIDAPGWRAAIRLAVGYAVLLLLWIGLAPFIFGAASLSATSQVAETGVGALAAFLVQLLGSGSLLVTPIVALLYFAGAGLLVLLGGIGLGAIVARRGLGARHDPAVGIALALLAGIAVTVASAFLLKGFDPLAPRYNIWMLPPIALLIGLAGAGVIGPGGKALRPLRLGALALLLIGAGWGQIAFLKRADWFVHGPSRTLEWMVSASEAPGAIVHVGKGWAWGYFPLYWRHRDALPQWLLTPDGRGVTRIDRVTGVTGPVQPLSALDGYRTLIVGTTTLLGHDDLRALDRGTVHAAPSREMAPGLATAGWQAGQALYRPGNYAFTGQFYMRRATPGPPGPQAMEDPE